LGGAPDKGGRPSLFHSSFCHHEHSLLKSKVNLLLGIRCNLRVRLVPRRFRARDPPDERINAMTSVKIAAFAGMAALLSTTAQAADLPIPYVPSVVSQRYSNKVNWLCETGSATTIGCSESS
jgi:hypothetical protein